MDAIQLFLRSPDTRSQALERGLEPGVLATLADQAEAAPLASPATYQYDPGGDPNSLADQGWAVVVPDDRNGDRLLDLAGPLVDKRADDQQAEVAIYRVPPGQDARDAALWLDRQFEGNNLQEDIPGYVLILGQLDQVSLELQQVLSSASHVGRLGFWREDHYAAYVDKLLRSEGTPATAPGKALFFTARDGSPATELGHRALMQPTLDDARAQRTRGKFPASAVIDIAGRGNPVADALLTAAADPVPSALFSCSHGLGAPRDGWKSVQAQRTRQGALCLGDDCTLTGDDVAERPFLPGGLWLLFACYGAGTPSRSAYHHWLRGLRDHDEYAGDLDSVLAALPAPGDPPFLAALPLAALANPSGPLAVVGHIDLAWSYSFLAVEAFGARERHRRFYTFLREVVRGRRVGPALCSLWRAREQAKADIAIAADRATRANAGGDRVEQQSLDAAEKLRLGHRWMLHQDLDGYIVLGDPAARLAVAPRAATRRARRQRSSTRDRVTRSPTLR